MAMLPIVDTPPANGIFVEHFDLELTDEEIAAGNADGDLVEDKDPDGV